MKSILFLLSLLPWTWQTDVPRYNDQNFPGSLSKRRFEAFLIDARLPFSRLQPHRYVTVDRQRLDSSGRYFEWDADGESTLVARHSSEQCDASRRSNTHLVTASETGVRRIQYKPGKYVQ